MQNLTFDYPKTRDTILQIRVSFFYVVDQKLYRHEKCYSAKENSSYGVNEEADSIDGYPIWFIMKSYRYNNISDGSQYERLQKFFVRNWIAHKECMQGELGVDFEKIRLRFRDSNEDVYRVKVTGNAIYFVEYEKQIGEGEFAPFEEDIIDPELSTDEVVLASGKKLRLPEFEDHEIATIVEGESEYPILLDEEMLRSIRSILSK